MSSEPSDTPASEDTEDGRDQQGSTTDTAKRHWLTNDLMAGLLGLSLIGLVSAHGLALVDLTTLPEPLLYLYVGAVGSAVVWTFGKDAIEAWRGGGA